MSYEIGMVVDCVDPHVLADWWAETLGWTVEPSNEDFIRSMVEQGHATEDETTYHRGTLVWRDGAAICRAAEVGRPDRERVLFQRVPEPRSGKNRVHWDVRLGGDDREAVRARLEERGATFLWEASQGPHTWCTMADPEGNEFCIS